jgi:hypothetical protein
MYQRILIPLDGSKASGAALSRAGRPPAWSSAFSR